MVKSGLFRSYGIGFWGPNGHDGIWHISLIESLSRFSLQMPVFAGEMLRNYHFGYDLLLALVHKLTFIPVSWLYFQITPPLLALGIGHFASKFILSWTKDSKSVIWGLFFIYFGGSFGWIITLIRHQGLGGESMFWAQQSLSTLVNPPFALSLLIIFLVLYRLTVKKHTTSKSQLITSLLIGSLSLVKIYSAILFLPGLAIAAAIDPRLRKILYYSILFSIVFYFPFNHSAGSLIVWQPFWFVENMLALSDRFYWPKLHQAMLVYKTTRNFIKFVPAYTLAILIFLIGNMGMRVLGLFMLKPLRKFTSIDIILWTIALLGFVLPLLLLQKGTPWNTIQFFYYSQFILGIFAARWLSKTKNFLVTVSCLLLTLPSIFTTLRHYLPSRPPAMIGSEEVKALKFLSSQPRGVVFTPPVNPDPYHPAPRPLFAYESTAYVSAYSKKPVYLEDTVNLDITDYSWEQRLDQAKLFMRETDLETARKFLYSNNIRYIYLPQIAQVRPYFSASELDGQVIFENSQVSIWQMPKFE